MENIIKRIPNLGVLILNNLDDQSLAQSKRTSREVAKLLDNERFYWIRILGKYSKHFEGFEESWNDVINKTPSNVIKQLAVAVQKFFELKISSKKVAPIHIAVNKGSFQLCDYVATKTRTKKPNRNLIYVMKLVIKELDDQSLVRNKEANREIGEYLENERFYWLRIIKNYTNNFEGFEEFWKEVLNKAPDGIVEQLSIAVQEFYKQFPRNYRSKSSPHYFAATKGNLKLCEFVIENTTNKNPVNKYGITPLHRAATNGYLDVCRLIIVKVEDKNPTDSDGWTPLHYAAINGHLNVCRLIIDNVDNKHPVNNVGETPEDLADNIEVYQLFQSHPILIIID